MLDNPEVFDIQRCRIHYVSVFKNSFISLGNPFATPKEKIKLAAVEVRLRSDSCFLPQ